MDNPKQYLPHVARTLAIAVLYAAATLLCIYVVGSYSFGPVQFRLSEALCALALFTPEAIPGLAIGCAAANIINLSISELGTVTLLDILICAVLPLTGAIFAHRLRRRPYLASLIVLAVNVVVIVFLKETFGTIGVLDVILGSLATIIGALFTWKHRERPGLALLGPVLANAIIVPTYLPLMLEGMDLYRIPFTDISVESSYLTMYLFGFVAVAIGEAVVVYGLGGLLALLIEKTKLKDLIEVGQTA